MHGFSRFRIAAGALAIFTAPLLLSGCSMDTKTDMAGSTHRVELRQSNKVVRVPTAVVGKGMITELADEYRRQGVGTIEVTVSYDPKSKKNTAMKASDKAAFITREFKSKGYHDIDVAVLPVKGSGDKSESVFSFGAFVAEEPTGCEAMGGVDGQVTGARSDYKYGCTTEMQLARQIANPKDLAGRGGLDTASGRRQANIVEGYKTGEANKPFQGAESSSQ